MLFTKATIYTLHALVELSNFNKPVDVSKLASLTTLPKPFLAKLLQHLSKKGFIDSFKGINGGFVLAKKPSEIKIMDVFKAIEEKDLLIFYCSNEKEECIRKKSFCKIRPFLINLEKEFLEIIKNYTLADVIRMSAGK
ncbi:MAG TPA: Rrf2 family transcriptional regulator [Nautiliaceae bacterium]|nr:Rrf2 family transcriptional regulator [Nautiliaceae bacterium]